MNKLQRIFFMLCILLFTVGCKENNPEPEKTPVAENGDPIELANFTITLTDLHAGDVFFTVEPKQAGMTYYYNLILNEDAEKYSDDQIIEADIANFEYIASRNGLTLEQLLSENLTSGKVEWMFKGLMASSKYCLYVYGVDTDGTVTTEMDRLYFETPVVTMQECGFEIEFSNVQSNSFTATIVPENDQIAYFFDVFTAQTYEDACGSDPEVIGDYLLTYVTEVAAQAGVDIPYTVYNISNYGAVVADFGSMQGVTANTTYYVFAVGIGPDGTATTEAVIKPVTTGRPPVNTFEAYQSSISYDRASFSVIPSHTESYVALFERKSYMFDESGNHLSDDEIIDAILQSQGSLISNHLYSGSATVSECPLIPDENYYLLVFGYFAGEVTTPLTKVEFSTTEAGRSECTFDIMVSYIGLDTFSASFDPYLQPTPYVGNYMTYEKFVEYGGESDPDAAIERFTTEEIEALYQEWSLKDHADIKEFMSRRLPTGYSSAVYEGLESGKDYIVYAIGMAADGSYTTDATWKKVTTDKLVETPQLDPEVSKTPSGILYNLDAWGTCYVWFYFDTDSGISNYGKDARKNDSSFYDLTDEEIKNYYLTEGETWPMGNKTYDYVPVDGVGSGDNVYSVITLFGEPVYTDGKITDYEDFTVVREHVTF